MIWWTISLLQLLPALVDAWVAPHPKIESFPVAFSSAADIEQPSIEDVEKPKTTRSKINEIDYCIDPADVSLGSVRNSMTYALNDASNRVVRRILLARSWSSPEALNQSLVQQSKQKQQKKRRSKSPRSDTEYVADQLMAFRNKYEALENFPFAEEYLDCILALATLGEESEKVASLYKNKVYDEAYRRVLNVLKTVGVSFLVTSESKQRILAPKLKDQDICLSVMDKLKIKQNPTTSSEEKSNVSSKKRSFWRKNKDAPDGILLTKDAPSITIQLNAVSNIVLRALLFGGDEELLVIVGTLESDRQGFIECWFPDKRDRPGLDYLDALIALLRSCYDDRIITSLDPLVQLTNSYANAYERLVATAVELGSGYLKPELSSEESLPKPRTPQEELGRFAVWETQFRQGSSAASDSDDIIGSWQVQDVVGGETIGVTNVTFLENGLVDVAAPLEGRQWQLDPGPTHLDTCTFEVLTADGNLLKYRGFIDRGARLEARFSKRPLRIRGSVQFQMRDGASTKSFYKDIIPINYRTGTTKFVMTKTSTNDR